MLGELPEIHSTCWPASKCCRTKLFEIKQQHELCGKSFRFGRYNKYQETFQHTHTHTHLLPCPISHGASSSIAAYVLWVCEYIALCTTFLHHALSLPAFLQSKSFESNANTVCESMSSTPDPLQTSTLPFLPVRMCLGRISMLHTFCCPKPIPAVLLMHCPGKAEQVYLNCKTCSFSLRCRREAERQRGVGAANFSKSYRNTKNVEHV